MGTKEEINEMFDALERTVEPDAEPEPEPEAEPAQEEPKVDESAQTPATEASKAESEEKVEAEAETPATTPPKEDDELARIKAEADELRQKIAELTTKPKEPEKEKPPATDPPIADQDFVKDVDLDEVTREPSAFNKLLNTIYKKAVETVRGEVRSSKEEVIKTVPEMVQRDLEVKQSLKAMSEKFYENNKDLKPFAKVVGVVFEELASENPKLKYNEILEKVGVETRNRLGLKKSADSEPANNNPKDDDPPPLPRKKGGRVTQPKQDSNPLVNEIDQMNKVLGR